MGPCKKGGTKGELGRSQVKMRESIGRFWHEAIMSSSALARFLATPPGLPDSLDSLETSPGPPLFCNDKCGFRTRGLVKIERKDFEIIFFRENESTSPEGVFPQG